MSSSRLEQLLNFYKSSPDDVILLQYTGGTTGVAKGAMLTNRNLVANMAQTRAVMMPFLKEGEDSRPQKEFLN